MFHKLLKASQETGCELLLALRDASEYYRGRVLELEEGAFTLFHSGPGGGMLWAFQIADVSHCGLILDPPSDLLALGTKLDLPQDASDSVAKSSPTNPTFDNRL